jgi:hypothetical protein
MSLIIDFSTPSGVDYLPLKALDHQLLHLAGCPSTYSFVATDEGNHETNISTIVESFVEHVTT